jgi:hypothetical protein
MPGQQSPFLKVKFREERLGAVCESLESNTRQRLAMAGGVPWGEHGRKPKEGKVLDARIQNQSVRRKKLCGRDAGWVPGPSRQDRAGTKPGTADDADNTDRRIENHLRHLRDLRFNSDPF